MIHFLPSQGEAQTMARAAMPARAVGGSVGGVIKHDTVVALNATDPSYIHALLWTDHKVYVDVDDNYSELLPGEAAAAHIECCAAATGVICASDKLAERYADYSDNVHVIHSASACPPGFFTDTKIIGWAAGRTHHDDYELIKPALLRAYELGWIVHVMGDAPCPAFALHIPYSSLARYYEVIAGWDIGLAPLKPGPVNDYRSDLKWQDYSSAGVVTVASKAPAYKTMHRWVNGAKATDSDDFVDVVEQLIGSDEQRERIRTNASEAANHRRTYLANAYKAILN